MFAREKIQKFRFFEYVLRVLIRILVDYLDPRDSSIDKIRS